MSYKVIPVKQAAELMDNDEVVVLDMRDGRAFQEGRIDGAVQVTDEYIVQLLEELDTETPVLIYCYYGVSSRKLADYLVSQGLSNVYSLDGGWGAWCLHNT